jgi:hypothetical protein
MDSINDDLNGLTERLNASIARAERARGLDKRFSYSSVRIEGERELAVELSREEVRGDVLTDLGASSAGVGDGGTVPVEATGGVRVRIRLLRSPPDRVLWVTTSVADLRREPVHTAELVSQLIMGERADRLKQEGDWFLVHLPDGYHGWIRSWYVAEVAREVVEAYERRINVRFGANIGYILSEPRARAIPISDVVAGSRLIAGAVTGDYREVTLPIDREGFIRKSDLESLHNGVPSRSRLIERARRFMGITYLWGGTSPKAFDCSGFVKQVFQLEGIELPRDSDLQARAGEAIPPGELSNVRPGDLLFFGDGGVIKHVAIFTGDGRFIHAYGCVRVNSLMEGDPLYEEKLAKSLLSARTVFGREQ